MKLFVALVLSFLLFGCDAFQTGSNQEEADPVCDCKPPAMKPLPPEKSTEALAFVEDYSVLMAALQPRPGENLDSSTDDGIQEIKENCFMKDDGGRDARRGRITKIIRSDSLPEKNCPMSYEEILDLRIRDRGSKAAGTHQVFFRARTSKLERLLNLEGLFIKGAHTLTNEKEDEGKTQNLRLEAKKKGRITFFGGESIEAHFIHLESMKIKTDEGGARYIDSQKIENYSIFEMPYGTVVFEWVLSKDTENKYALSCRLNTEDVSGSDLCKNGVQSLRSPIEEGLL